MKIKELYIDASKWTQGTFARQPDGTITDANSPHASSFCLVGAVIHCYNDITERDRILDLIRDTIPESIVSWNDSPNRTFREVRELVERLDV